MEAISCTRRKQKQTGCEQLPVLTDREVYIIAYFRKQLRCVQIEFFFLGNFVLLLLRS